MSEAVAAPAPEQPRPRSLSRFHTVQGEFHVTRQPDIMLTTTLGSSVAA